MASNKLARTNDDIQRVLANLLTQVKDPRVQQGMISVTRVETTGDLRYSKVWLSVLGMENEIGSLREGKKADVILIDLNQPSLAPVITYPFRNLVANLVYSARGSEVRTSIIDGNIVMDMTLFINCCPRGESRTERLARALLKALGEYEELRLYDEPLHPLGYADIAKRDALLAEKKYDDEM